MPRNRLILFLCCVGLLTACASSQTNIETSTEREPASHVNMPGMTAEAPSGTLAACQAAQGFSEKVSPAQQNVINEIVGSRGHRLLHALWHATRAGLSTQERTQAVQAYGITWTQEHKYCPPPGTNAEASNYNPVGEDFLFMHREMTEMIRAGLIALHLQCIQPWSGVPDPKTWPLPDSDTSGAKSPQALQQLQEWDAKMQNTAWLRSVSLSQLGMALEISTHNNLHMRYATTKPPAGFPGVERTGGAPIPYSGKFSSQWPYDNPSYNWLADPYGAALNPVFWKIHGYVDGMIDKWLVANNYKSIAEKCPAGDRSCYQWRGTWTGSMPNTIVEENGSHRGVASDESQTTAFNQNRMHKQWIGVIGGDPNEPPTRGIPGAPAPVDISDPFKYAVQQECGGAN